MSLSTSSHFSCGSFRSSSFFKVCIGPESPPASVHVPGGQSAPLGICCPLGEIYFLDSRLDYVS